MADSEAIPLIQRLERMGYQVCCPVPPGELAPCPWCGSAPKLVVNKEEEYVGISCSCDVLPEFMAYQGYYDSHDSDEPEETLEEAHARAIAEWNKAGQRPYSTAAVTGVVAAWRALGDERGRLEDWFPDLAKALLKLAGG